MKKNLIWTSDVDVSDEAINEYRSENDSDLSDDAITDILYSNCNIWKEDEIMNLDIPTDHPIICIADLGLWNGRAQGFRILRDNLSSIFDVLDSDYAEVFADNHNVRARYSHHDGTNYYLFRELRKEPEECGSFLDAIYSGKKLTSQYINSYTKSIVGKVNKVYGW